MEKLSLLEFLKLSKADLKGKVFCFPTDTVYGISALYGDEEGIKKIYQIKKRDLKRPLANLCSRIDQITDLGITISPNIRKVIDKYWPGPLTIILDGLDEKLSFRMPDSKIALQILDQFSLLPTTSINESGSKELNSLKEIEDRFGNEIDYFITDYVEPSGLPSTVVDLSGGKIKILRQGAIYLE